MKENLLKITLIILSYIFVMAFVYFAIAFIRLEINFANWIIKDRAGFIAVGTIISIMPISAILLWWDNIYPS